MPSSTKIVLVALAAGALGVIASVALNGPGPLLGTEVGQRVVQETYRATAPQPPPGVAIAKRDALVPAFPVPNLAGKAVIVPTAYAGRPLLINIWASWCGPCLKEMPELQRFHSQQGVSGTQVVGIALDDTAAVKDFLRGIAVDYPILVDTAGPADAGVRLGNPKGVLPYSVLLSADGTLLKQRIGPFADGEIDRWAHL
jgi:thiol-disulfide isomerase/thioredoxin